MTKPAQFTRKRAPCIHRARAEVPVADPTSTEQSFAYLFERFPSFVQTFVYREAIEMVRQKMNPWLVSIRKPEDRGNLAAQVEADIFYLPDEKVLRQEVDARRSDGRLGWRVHKAIPRHRGERDSQRMFEAIWLAPELKGRGIRHVHAHFGGMATRTAYWLKQLFGISYSFTGHANDIFCETDYPLTNADLARDATFIVTETDYARRWMEERHPVARGRVFRVFNGIDPTGFFPRQTIGVIPRIVSVGRYVEKKGFDILIDACAILRDRGIQFTCDLIGGGPLEDVLQRMVADREVEKQVRILGPLSQDEVRRELAMSQVFALACQSDAEGGSDNLPTVIAEAMFTGLPCISTDIAGVPEMIENEVNGLLVPSRNAAALADGLERLVSDRQLADRLAQAGLATAKEKFSIEKTVQELRELLIKKANVSDPTRPRRWWPW
jgi:colanic acid/amylovoran biosynthesis glycosyltransferase